MKVILEFDSFSEADELDTALNGGKYRDKLDEVWQKLFRPRHKHAYGNERINDLIAFNGPETPESIACNELLDYLEQVYRDIVHED
jgi:hypothetical protein